MQSHQKRALIIKYVIPALGNVLHTNEGFVEQLIASSYLVHAVKYQQLEMPGYFEDGCVWFSIDAIVHSYYYCPYKLVKKGTRIWSKREFILFSSCLLKREQRTDYLEILEAGIVIYIKYAQLLALLDQYTELENQIKLVSVNNERYYHNRNLMMNKPPVERVKQLHTENKLFINSSSQVVQAMHANLSLRGYLNQLSKLK
ncbi:hypothetical protein [Pedobacter nyackensis]|uniref:hypothetical protein n=1 Tax=Pedobacter nyackensis TaxID=475255 RepID=UPI00292F0351|nr:hypothetical protein [Pedobacter nyackensis]